MSSSESDNEEIQKLKEAISSELMQCMSTNSSVVREKPKSLRKNCSEQNEENTHSIALKTTPEFRNHVSKKLSTYLDSVIEVVKCEQFKPNDDIDEVGVKLLKNSVCFLKDSDEITTDTSYKTVVKNCFLSSDSSDDEKLAQVVVSGMDILNGGEGAFKKEKIDPKSKSLKKIKKRVKMQKGSPVKKKKVE